MSERKHLSEIKAEEKGVKNYKKHILICLGPDCTDPEKGKEVWDYLKERLAAEGLSDTPEAEVYRSKAGCLRICAEGPIAVVYPDGVWYRGVDKTAVDLIIEEHLKGGRVVEKYLLAVNPNFQK